MRAAGGYTARLPGVITAIVMIDAATDSIPEVASAIADLDGVSEVYSTAGEVDLIAIVRVREFEQVAEVIAGRSTRCRACSRPRRTSPSGPTPSTTSKRPSRSASTPPTNRRPRSPAPSAPAALPPARRRSPPRHAPSLPADGVVRPGRTLLERGQGARRRSGARRRAPAPLPASTRGAGDDDRRDGYGACRGGRSTTGRAEQCCWSAGCR